MVSVIQRAARITAQAQLINGGTSLSRQYLSLSLISINVLLAILIASSCRPHSVHPCSSLTPKRKVRVQRPCLAVTPHSSTWAPDTHSSHQLPGVLEGTSNSREQPHSLCSIGCSIFPYKSLCWAHCFSKSWNTPSQLYQNQVQHSTSLKPLTTQARSHICPGPVQENLTPNLRND